MDSLDLLNINSVASTVQSSASAAQTDRLKNQANTASTDEEMLAAAKEFESYLWEQVIKEMKNTVSLFDDEESGANKQLVDYFMDSSITNVAKSMTEQTYGTNSLAMQMYEQMKRTNAITLEELREKQAAETETTSEVAGEESLDASEISENVINQGLLTE